MTPKVQNVAPAPVSIGGDFPHLRIESWSGREDSNLRPLPPEGISPSRIALFSVPFTDGIGAYSAACLSVFKGLGFNLNLGALSLPTPLRLAMAGGIEGED